MSGATGLKGLVYQQRYVLYRVLSALGDETTGVTPCARLIAEFSIEGTTSGDSPVWDVWVRHRDDHWDFDECKDTAIEKTDRRALPPSAALDRRPATPSATALRPLRGVPSERDYRWDDPAGTSETRERRGGAALDKPLTWAAERD